MSPFTENFDFGRKDSLSEGYKNFDASMEFDTAKTADGLPLINCASMASAPPGGRFNAPKIAMYCGPSMTLRTSQSCSGVAKRSVATAPLD